MASTYSDRLKLELMETGANANVWGTNTNNNLDVVDSFGAGYLAKSVAGSADVTLTTADADPDAESSNKVIEFTGTLTGDIKVFVPAVENNYIFFNNTAGAHTLTVAPTGHASNGVAIVQGAHTIQYCKGDRIIDLFADSLGTVSVKNLVNVANTVKIHANGQMSATSYTGDGSTLANVVTLEAGTQMAFLESSAPTGWTQNTAAALNNSTLRIVTGTGGGTGGTDDFGDVFTGSKATATGNIDLDTSGATVDGSTVTISSHTLSTPEIASHSHPAAPGSDGGSWPRQGTTPYDVSSRGPGGVSGSTGGGGGHTHPSGLTASISGTASTPTSYTVPNMDIKHANIIICTKDS